MNEVIEWYDSLATDDDDPVYDVPLLRNYMDKWDGDRFFESLNIMKDFSVMLEIGIGTGRLAKRVVKTANRLVGIDISPKTIDRAKYNLSEYDSVVRLVCGDFIEYEFNCEFDIIYSSLTFMHFKDKQYVFDKVYQLLHYDGRFVLSIDKNTSDYIYYGAKKLKVYPDYPDTTRAYIEKSGLTLIETFETEFAHIFVCIKEHKR